MNNQSIHISESGAKSSYDAPNYFLMPRDLIEAIAHRFEEGNRKYEDSNNVYEEANWREAWKKQDWKFFRKRAVHACNHLWDELRGFDDPDLGGNLGAVGWFLGVMAEIRNKDYAFYRVIQGLDKPKQDALGSSLRKTLAKIQKDSEDWLNPNNAPGTGLIGKIPKPLRSHDYPKETLRGYEISANDINQALSEAVAADAKINPRWEEIAPGILVMCGNVAPDDDPDWV